MSDQEAFVTSDDDVFELAELRATIEQVWSLVRIYRKEGESLVVTVERALQGEYAAGESDGESEGYDTGYSEGYDNGYDAGFSVGSENDE